MKTGECYSEILQELPEGLGDILVYFDDGMWIYSDFTYDPNTYLIKLKFIPEDNNDPYFDFVRISMLKPEYIVGEHKGRLLTKREKEKFINALNKPRLGGNIYFDDKEYPLVWEALIACHNKFYLDSNVNKQLPLDLPIPDYNILGTLG